MTIPTAEPRSPWAVLVHCPPRRSASWAMSPDRAASPSDPYASATFPSFSGCDENNLTIKTATTKSQGVYCGGISINAGATLTLNPGIYYLDQGSLSMAGNATLTGTGVTL